ncbi:mitochondrial carrier [Paraphysoderma sedebokerense]|nr:mitochondrial carrier [Paraphysoderma sedebokerense]
MPDAETKRAAKEIVAGSFGGICQVLSGQPFDTIKVRIQTQPTPPPGQPPLYNGVVDCVKKTYQNDGFRGFYKGTLTPLLGVGLCVSIQFAVLEHTKRWFGERAKKRSPTGDLTLSELYMSGAVAGLANSFVSGPVEHIRTRLQVQTSSSASGSIKTGAMPNHPFQLIRYIASNHGISGLYKGQGVTMLREFHGYGIYFATYEAIIRWMCAQEHKKREELATWKVVGAGALAGYALWLSIYPVDTVKSKLQTDSLDPAQRQYKSMLDCFRKTIARDGPKGLFRGFVPCMVRAAPVNGVTFAGFEVAMRVLGRDE